MNLQDIFYKTSELQLEKYQGNLERALYKALALPYHDVAAVQDGDYLAALPNNEILTQGFLLMVDKKGPVLPIYIKQENGKLNVYALASGYAGFEDRIDDLQQTCAGVQICLNPTEVLRLNFPGNYQLEISVNAARELRLHYKDCGRNQMLEEMVALLQPLAVASQHNIIALTMAYPK
ncbi:MAG: hypothetical protein V1859_03215 [archaeon]